MATLAAEIPGSPVLLAETVRSVVYRIKEEVFKVDKLSLRLSPVEKTRRADRLSAEHAALARNVGSSVLPQSVDVRSHPLESSTTAVQVVQSYREIDFIRLNKDRDSVPWLAEYLIACCNTYPNVLNEIRAVLAGSRTLQMEQQLGFDIIGADNYGIDRHTNEFTIIDALPIPADEPHVLEQIGGYLDNVDAALDIAAMNV